MSAAKDDTQPDVTGHGASAAGVAAAARRLFVVGGDSGKAGKWFLPGMGGIDKNLHKVFFERKPARLRQAVSMAPKRSSVFHVRKTGTNPIRDAQKMIGWLAGLAGGGFSVTGPRVGWGKRSSWLGRGHVLPGPVRHLAGWHRLPKKTESFGAKPLLIRPTGRVARVRSFAPVGMATPLRVSGLESRFVAPAYQVDIRPQTAWQAGSYGHGLAPVVGGWRQNQEVSERGAGAVPDAAGKDPRAGVLDMSRAMGDYFAHQARLPPSGAMAFDPRLTPAWAGLKLPV